MNRAQENRSIDARLLEEPPEDVRLESSRNGKTPFVPHKEKPKASLGHGGRLLFIGAGIVFVFLLFAFSNISQHSSPAQKRSAKTYQPQNARQPEDVNPTTSLTPILDAGQSPEWDTNDNRILPDQIGRLATKETKGPVARSLGDVPPFGNTQNWQPAPYPPGAQTVAVPDTQAGPGVAAQATDGREVIDKASLVFVRNNTSPPATQKSQEPMSQIDVGSDLLPGTRLRARLESAISTAVETPVVAVIEYNYEQQGDIVIPAGAKAFGHLESADHSGYLGIRFESLQMPDGASVGLEAAATDLQLRPLRGKVEGKHAGKSILVRSFAGVGEIAATLVGRGSLNQPLSEEDLLRERLTNNIGQASDQSVASLGMTEHVVVSLPAGTEIYVILQKSAVKSAIEGPRTPATMQTSRQPSIDELRELLQLQRELNQTVTAKPLD